MAKSEQQQSIANFKIDKNVPMPAPYSRTKYPFRLMEIGDSFVIPDGVARQYISSYAANAGKRLGRKFSVRKAADGSVRCWRVS